MIAFEHSDLAPGSPMVGWVEKKLNAELSYIELTGEQVSFVADGVNGIASPDPRLGHAGGTGLLPAYRPPYSGASAVFLIPAGTLTACTSDTASGRIDTKLALKNLGTLTIKAPGKSVTFKGGARVFVANVPLAWAKTKTATPGAVSHHTVYCAMTGNTKCDITVVNANAAGGIPSCKEVAMKNAAGGPADFPTATDVFCSNSQWP